jgi:hypothetical protein
VRPGPISGIVARMTEHEPDHMGALRPDEPLPATPDDVATPDTGDVRTPSADVDRESASGRSHEEEVDADAEAAEDVTGRLTSEG